MKVFTEFVTDSTRFLSNFISSFFVKHKSRGTNRHAVEQNDFYDPPPAGFCETTGDIFLNKKFSKRRVYSRTEIDSEESDT